MARSVTVAVVAVGLAPSLLGGCTTDDPRQGGFFGGLVGLVTGRYDRGVEERQARLAAVRDEGERLGAEGRGLTAARDELAATIDGRERELHALTAQTAEAEAEIDAVRRHLADAEAAQRELNARIARLDEELFEGRGAEEETAAEPAPGQDAATAAARRRELERLIEEAGALKEEMAALERDAADAEAHRAQLRAQIERLKEELAPAPGS